ncbi:fructose-bisphosphatase, class II [Saccharopolyspora erythraea NRRL 2338]|uniref:Fructose-1,6-bisphosphatase class 2 n=2 Tax=Saccharopolyspora erythraea TaxID=1836 RepID=A4FJE1_SACEN|nr:fructose 1,6-bisphosphatase [Saccharopolyspora erythraea D]QRK87972.1 fructose-bisphosphatase class II [Saccharopolyspora erythraea]CAM04166.1 fructose-bisphosphatase, class II [Saccharopolyspora erythraea NRRL 2338]
MSGNVELGEFLRNRRARTAPNVFFCATGITDGALLRGVHYRTNQCSTQSIVMRSKSGTVRMIDGSHRLSKLREYANRAPSQGG